jgi:phosphoenolpyruvate carboxylase
VFEAIAQARHKFGGRAIGEYIVSGAQGPEDVLAVLLLARWADITDKRTGESPLDVAPLLESIESLERAGDILRSLCREPAYRRHLASRGNTQMVMIGYSDTNKEGGIAASRWALQVAQTQLLDAAREAGIKVLIFHGRGGTPARGGGRTENLVEAVPDGAIRGVLRLTEQGEVVNQSYGLRPIAMRTLERTFASVALATAHAGQRAPIPLAQAAAMQTIAARSLSAYRDLVFGRRDRTHAYRLAPGGSRRRQRSACITRHSVGVCLDAKPSSVARMVRLRQRHIGRTGAARR